MVRRFVNGPLASRYSTMFFAKTRFKPDTRASSGADAVLMSTPTALTQSSTVASSDRASARWFTSCWYCPTPIDLGSIFTNSAKRILQPSGDGDGAAEAHVQCRKLRRGKGRSRIDRGARLAHHDLGHFLLRLLGRHQLDHLDGELIGLTTGGAIADRDQFNPVLHDQTA